MILDLFLALVALGGAAFLGYLIGKQTTASQYESTLEQRQYALDEAQMLQSQIGAQLERCTRRRREMERKIADLNARKDKTDTPKADKIVSKPPARVQAMQQIQAKPKKAEAQSKATARHTNDEVLERIKDKAEQINFDRIGRSSQAEKDDLKKIKGVGPYIEKKLNALGIYTFAQVSNFNQEDEVKVNEAIEFFPGRIKRDQWVAQAQILKDGKTTL
ncbi:hypothetical protein PZB74_14430 [Porifericola rhodea]|uniref:hypothetical protein n=1 Tax=Porifericola rhodea TaxID=930972 RepID=UPI0026663A2A|nr:hypothetical protein [Porifericola rhodea]WKN30159.1 hypothetical protein PZB74_14430 [Porifericola rhodea]